MFCLSTIDKGISPRTVISRRTLKMPLRRKGQGRKISRRVKYEDDNEEEDGGEVVEEDEDDKPRPCQICKLGFRKGQKRNVCQTEDCPKRFHVHTECLQSAVDQHEEVRIFCQGCRQTKKYVPTTRISFNKRSIAFAAIVIVLVIGLSFLPYHAWVWFSQDLDFFPQAKRARTWGIQIAYSWAVISFVCTCGVVLYAGARCCCMPCFMVCGICRRGSTINY